MNTGDAEGPNGETQTMDVDWGSQTQLWLQLLDAAGLPHLGVVINKVIKAKNV